MKNVMIDFETWGNTANSIVVQIGACYFNRTTGEIGETFNLNIDANSEANEGFVADADTIYWWFEKTREAQRAAFGYKSSRVNSRYAWEAFNKFLKKSSCIWSHATFDFIILRNHIDTLGIKPNFHYRDARDIRTLTDLASGVAWGNTREGVHHNALDDCIYQVGYCVDCLNAIKRRKK